MFIYQIFSDNQFKIGYVRGVSTEFIKTVDNENEAMGLVNYLNGGCYPQFSATLEEISQEILFFTDEEIKPPSRGTSKSAGIDMHAPFDFKVLPGKDILVNSGVAIKSPDNSCFVCLEKSGIATKKKLILGAKVIDEDYTGFIHFHIWNLGEEIAEFKKDEKVLQIVFLNISYPKILHTQDLFDITKKKTERGDGGFGSTGK